MAVPISTMIRPQQVHLPRQIPHQPQVQVPAQVRIADGMQDK